VSFSGFARSNNHNMLSAGILCGKRQPAENNNADTLLRKIGNTFFAIFGGIPGYV